MSKTNQSQEGKNMATKKESPEVETVETVEEVVEEATVEEAENEGLVTVWSERPAAIASFDADQAAIHAWHEADQKEALKTLEQKMTLADAEELIWTAKDIAEEHKKRALAAERLAELIAARLARTAGESTSKTASTAYSAAAAAKTEKSAKPVADPTPTKKIPTFLEGNVHPDELNTGEIPALR